MSAAVSGGQRAPAIAPASGIPAANGGWDDAGAGTPEQGGALAKGTFAVATTFVAPRIVSADQVRSVQVFGSRFRASAGHMVSLDGEMLGMFAPSSDTQANVELPKLAPGEHVLTIDGVAELRVVAIARQRFDDSDLALPGQVQQALFDGERNAIFGVFNNELAQTSVARLRFDGTSWKIEPVEVPSPRSISLTADGRELLVLTAGCVMVRVSAETLKRTDQEVLSGCDANTAEARACRSP